MRRLLTIATLTLALSTTLTACGDDPTPAPTKSASPTTSAPSPTAPVLPDAAKANTTVGAKAFVRFYFEALTHAMRTGDTRPMDAHAAADCEACVKIGKQIHKIYNPGGRNKGGGWKIDELQEAPDSTSQLRRFVVVADQPAQALVSPSGRSSSATPLIDSLSGSGSPGVRAHGSCARFRKSNEPGRTPHSRCHHARLLRRCERFGRNLRGR